MPSSGLPPARPGRPLDVQLTRRLLEAAVEELADGGWSTLSAARLLTRAQSGKAAVYRRWPDRVALTAEAVGTLHVLDPLPDEDDLLAEVIAYHQPLVRPLSRDARALASLLGAVHQQPRLAEAVHAALWTPLQHDLMVLLQRDAKRRAPEHAASRANTDTSTDASRQTLDEFDRLAGMSTSLWCRYLVLGSLFSAEELEQALGSPLLDERSDPQPALRNRP